jgi:hypothetical protein
MTRKADEVLFGLPPLPPKTPTIHPEKLAVGADRIVPDFVTTTSVPLFTDVATISGVTPSFVVTSINK